MQKALPLNHKQIIDKCSGRKKNGHPSNKGACWSHRPDGPSAGRLPLPLKGKEWAPVGNLVVCVTPELPPSSHEKAFLTAPTDFRLPQKQRSQSVPTHPMLSLSLSFKGTRSRASKPTPQATYPGWHFLTKFIFFQTTQGHPPPSHTSLTLS